MNKINISTKKQNSISFFGNLSLAKDFHDRTKMIMNIKSKIKSFDIYAETNRPSKYYSYKYKFLELRYQSSKQLKKIFPNLNLNNWENKKILPKDPWELGKSFTNKVLNPLYGREMFEKLSLYSMTFNQHNKHTGDVACNMRMFEATGMGSALVTDHKSDLCDYFLPDDEIVVYKNKLEAIEKIKYLLNNPQKTLSIAKKGQDRCHSSYNSKIINENFYNLILKC